MTVMGFRQKIITSDWYSYVSNKPTLINLNFMTTASRSQLEIYLDRNTTRTDKKQRGNSTQPSSFYQGTSFISAALTTQQHHRSERHALNTTQTSTPGFQRAQHQCLQQLRQLRNSLSQQLNRLERFQCAYRQTVMKNVLQQNTNIKEEFMRIINKAFEANTKRIEEAIMPKIKQQPIEIVNLKERIHQVTTLILQYESALKGANYKKAISQFIGSELGDCMPGILLEAENCRKIVSNRSFNLTIDINCYKRIRQDLLNMYMIEQVNLPVHVVQQIPMAPMPPPVQLPHQPSLPPLPPNRQSNRMQMFRPPTRSPSPTPKSISQLSHRSPFERGDPTPLRQNPSQSNISYRI